MVPVTPQFAGPKGLKRPLPDLCLIAVFKQLPPADQLKAAVMSPRCVSLMRAANHAVRTLVITSYDPVTTQSLLNPMSLFSKPSMGRLMKNFEHTVEELPFFNYPLGTAAPSALVRPWNCLQMGGSQSATTALCWLVQHLDLLVGIFSAVTELKLVYSADHFEVAVSLLPKWSGQLSSLMAINYHYRISQQEAGRLLAAINYTLPGLQYLAIDWQSDLPLPPLTPYLLAQLKVLAVNLFPRFAAYFLQCLEQTAAVGATSDQLQVHLLSNDTGAMLALPSESVFRRCIVRYGKFSIKWSDRVVNLCAGFPSLTSLALEGITHSNVAQVFATLSSLTRLIHLDLSVNLEQLQVEEEHKPAEPGMQPSLRPQTPIASVLVLDLWLSVRSHDNGGGLQWLNLQHSLPRLAVLNLKSYSCVSCSVGLVDYIEERYGQPMVASFGEMVACFRQSFHHYRPIKKEDPATDAAAAAAPTPILMVHNDWKGSRFAEDVFGCSVAQ